jgi:toxin-antitoxin system PIN domain toxin
VIVPDINLLLYATFSDSPDHRSSRDWWARLLNGSEAVALSAPAIFGFIRLATNPRAIRGAMTIEEAVALVESWLSRPMVEFVRPGARYLPIAFDLLRAARTGADLTSDVQLAALAIENQAELHSADTDFGRFSGLNWFNPLAKRK